MCQTVTKLLPCLLTEGQEKLDNMCKDLQVMLESDTVHSKDNPHVLGQECIGTTQ